MIGNHCSISGATPKGSTPTTHHRLACVRVTDRPKATSKPESSRKDAPSTGRGSRSMTASSAKLADSRPLPRVELRLRTRPADEPRCDLDRSAEPLRRRPSAPLAPRSTGSSRPSSAVAGLGGEGCGGSDGRVAADCRVGAGDEFRWRNADVGCSRPVGVRGGTAATSGGIGEACCEESGDSSDMRELGNTGSVKSWQSTPSGQSPALGRRQTAGRDGGGGRTRTQFHFGW